MSNVLNTDSYKASHFLQYPPDVQFVSGYIESRGGKYEDSLFFGLQYVIQKYLSTPITMDDVNEAEEIFTLHGEPFNREGWVEIVERFDGFLPLEIQAVPEGTVMPVKNVMVQVRNTEPGFHWLTTYVEPLLMQLWYPVTVGTYSMYSRRMIVEHMMKTCDEGDAGVIFKLHDFGLRGSSSMETASIGGMAHLVNFQGTDTVPALAMARKFYDCKMAGFSIPAAEHSTMTSWGKDKEVQAYRNMLKQFAKPGSLVAVVSDSYDVYNAVENIWGGELKQEVLDSGATLVIRPDSGDPVTVVLRLLEIAGEKFGYVENNKGYKVLNNAVRLIQGDGVNLDIIDDILFAMEQAGWSADNIAFGQGGGLLQQHSRDDMRFAMKASAKSYDMDAKTWVPFKKSPITDPGKTSKAGRLALVKENGGYATIQESDLNGRKNELITVWRNGEQLVTETFDVIRKRAW